MKIIEINNLTKTYNKGKVIALDNINLAVEESEIFGLIGPDGAGKTTLFRLLTTLLTPDKGNAKVLGYDIVEDFEAIRESVGYMPGRFSLYSDLTVKENLQFFATLFDTTIEENYHLIKDIYEQIEPFKNRRAGNLSGGMKQKLALSCALIHKPKLLFLDEPTTGIDPVSRVDLWNMLKKLGREGITIFVSTPYMDEATKCDRIAFIDNGHILNIESPENIITNYKQNLFAVKSEKTYLLLKALEKFPKTINSYAFGEYAHVVLNGDENQLKEYLVQNDFKEIDIKKIDPNIEDCFIEEIRVISQHNRGINEA